MYHVLVHFVGLEENHEFFARLFAVESKNIVRTYETSGSGLLK